jgi:hypothetical protein
MTYVDTGFSGHRTLASSGFSSFAHTVVSDVRRIFSIGQAGRLVLEDDRTQSEVTPRERRLEEIQQFISSNSMHLPRGFAVGLNGQFANMMAEDAWEDEDALPSMRSLMAFLLMLISTKAVQRPGIGTNGRGSISAFWRAGENRLTIDCLPSGNTRWVLTRVNAGGEIERAAAECQPERLCEVLNPFRPEVWFGQ